YSLAVSYAELRLGRLPFAGTDMYSLMMDHIEGNANFGSLPDVEQRVLRKALAKDPVDRFPNCLAFVQALEEVVEPAAVLQQSSASARRRRSTIHRGLPLQPTDVCTMARHDTPTEPPTRVEDDTQPPPAKPTWRQQPAPARKTSWTLVAVGCAVLLGLLGWILVLQFLGDYQLEPPEPVLLKAGHSNTVNVRVQRSRFDGLINFAATKAPHGVTLTGFIKAGADNADVTIRAEPDAELGEFTMTIRAEAEGHAAREARLALTIEPSYWNPGWRVAQG